ncbi:MAG: hypothetical protein CVV27_13740 [Candidatus Melainabacteria bacterium HGW-Melainabacteria-1]|nr:MAG: hypothetical protein CVV27_13740 [Candidatus Melainabacteria bacterium HGW-Melainabacteria-1]
MALKSTIFKAELQISDMDRHYYASHALTIARHPSETDERMMLRLLAFALHANERLEFTRGLSTVEEPELWRKSLTGEVEVWIELGQPDERRIRKACSQAEQVLLLTYGRGAEIWWQKLKPDVARFDKLSVLFVPPDACRALAELADRNMQLQVMLQEGQIWFSRGDRTVEIAPEWWMGSDEQT